MSIEEKEDLDKNFSFNYNKKEMLESIDKNKEADKNYHEILLDVHGNYVDTEKREMD